MNRREIQKAAQVLSIFQLTENASNAMDMDFSTHTANMSVK